MTTPRKPEKISRRIFAQQAGLSVGGILVAGAPALVRPAPSLDKPLPTRTLGRTGEQVTVLGLGCAPAGQSRSIDTPGVARVIERALDLGINLFDAARAYGNAEEALGQTLGSRRDRVFLTTKVWADDAQGAQRSFEESLRLLKTDHVDLLYLHSMGSRDPGEITAKGGSLEYLLKAKEEGKTRFIGLSGHHRPANFLPVIETGSIDVIMVGMNFADRFVYNFEERVLPTARKQECGILCMKVFGGIKGGFAYYGAPPRDSLLDPELHDLAIGYALEIPDVASLVIGTHTAEQLQENAEKIIRYKSLTDEQKTFLDEKGREIAQEWGPHLGAIA